MTTCVSCSRDLLSSLIPPSTCDAVPPVPALKGAGTGNRSRSRVPGTPGNRSGTGNSCAQPCGEKSALNTAKWPIARAPGSAVSIRSFAATGVATRCVSKALSGGAWLRSRCFDAAAVSCWRPSKPARAHAGLPTSRVRTRTHLQPVGFQRDDSAFRRALSALTTRATSEVSP